MNITALTEDKDFIVVGAIYHENIDAQAGCATKLRLAVTEPLKPVGKNEDHDFSVADIKTKDFEFVQYVTPGRAKGNTWEGRRIGLFIDSLEDIMTLNQFSPVFYWCEL